MNFGERRWEYIGLASSILARPISIDGRNSRQILSPNLHLAFERQIDDLILPFVFQTAFGD